MELDWELDSRPEGTDKPRRDFLAEATSLALQSDPVSWDFDLSDRDLLGGAALQYAQRLRSNDMALATIMIPGESEFAEAPTEWTSSDNSHDMDEEADRRQTRGPALEQQILKVRDKIKPSRQRRLQRYKDKCEEQGKTVKQLREQLEQINKEKAIVESHADLLEKALMKLSSDSSNHKPKAPEAPVFIPAKGWKSFDPRHSIVLTAVFDEPKSMTPKEASTISVRDYARLWTEYVIKARDCLEKIDQAERPDCPYLKKLKELLDERHGLISWTSANNLPMVHKLNSSNLENDLTAKHGSSRSFSSILQKLKLTDEQMRALVNSRNTYLLSIGFYSASLAKLQSQITVLDARFKESLRNSPYLMWTELARGLQESVEQIHLSYVRLHFEIYHGEQALTAVQAGTMLVECFPYIPDVIMLVRDLALLQSAPSSKDLLAEGAMRYAEKQGALEIPSEPYAPVVDKVGDLLSRVWLQDDCTSKS